MTTETTVCADTGCTSRCADYCGIGICGIDRKHYVRGGVCCISCCDLCHGCQGTFYNEGLVQRGEDSEGDPRMLCHCCRLLDKHGLLDVRH